MLKHWLWGTGILGFIALSMPWTVVVGMIFLIVPGLILMAAPTVFMYLVAFAIIRMLLPMPAGIGLNITAATLAILLGWAVTQPAAIAGKRAFSRANLPDIVPPSPIALQGHIRLITPDIQLSRAEPRTMECTALCAALLATNGVKSVTMVDAKADRAATPLTIRLVPKSAARERGLFPIKPESILSDLPPEPGPQGTRDFDAENMARTRRSQAAAAAWAIKLATNETLIGEVARSAFDLEVRVTEHRGNAAQPSIKRIEIRNMDDQTLMRRSFVSSSILAAPLHFSGTGGMENFKIGWGRKRLASGKSYPELAPVTELFLHSNLARPSHDNKLAPELVRLLDQAIADPSRPASDASFVLAETWFSMIDWSKPLSSREIDVLGLAIADPRVPITKSLYNGYADNIVPELRADIGTRIMHPDTPPETRTQLARLLANMPPGTFATLSQHERAFLGNGVLRKQTYPLIARLSDRGAAGVPDLIAILESDAQIKKWSDRWQTMKALNLAFARLGPEAGSALPVVESLVMQEQSPLLNQGYRERNNWYLALVQMGKPIATLSWPRSSPEEAARSAENLKRQIERFDPSKDNLE